jgi:hypothetical protein
VISDRDCRHAQPSGFFCQRLYSGCTIEHRILAVHMKVYKGILS